MTAGSFTGAGRCTTGCDATRCVKGATAFLTTGVGNGFTGAATGWFLPWAGCVTGTLLVGGKGLGFAGCLATTGVPDPWLGVPFTWCVDLGDFALFRTTVGVGVGMMVGAVGIPSPVARLCKAPRSDAVLFGSLVVVVSGAVVVVVAVSGAVVVVVVGLPTPCGDTAETKSANAPIVAAVLSGAVYDGLLVDASVPLVGTTLYPDGSVVMPLSVDCRLPACPAVC